MSVKKKECPSCGLDVEAKSRKCRFCGYEFPGRSQGKNIIAYVLIFLLLVWLLIGTIL